MGLTNYPNGVSSFGVPVLGGTGNVVTGNVWFVDSGASTRNDGKSPKTAFTTIDAAMNRAVASNGDTIFVMPGHAQNIADATTFLCDKIGVSVVGIGVGANAPAFTFTNTAGSVAVSAASVSIEGCRFIASVSAVVAGFTVTAADCTLRNNVFTFEATGDDWITLCNVTDVDRFTFEGNVYHGENAAGANTVAFLDNSDGTRLVGNHIFGQFNTGAFNNDTTTDTGDGAPVCLDLMIADNYIYNGDTTATAIGINLDQACTGMIVNNRIGILAGAAASTGIDPGSCLCLENYVVNAVDESGILVPTTAST